MTEPWVAVEATIRRSPKMTGLPNDTARYGWVVALGEAKLLQRGGAFLPGQWEEVMGRYSRHKAEYVAAGMLHVAPVACSEPRCMRGRGPFPEGSLVIHKWGVYQREHALRQDHYRNRRDGLSDAESDALSDVESDAESDALSRAVSPVYSPESLPNPRDGYQVPDDPGDEFPVLSWMAQNGAAVAANGNGFHRRIVVMVGRYGADRVCRAMADVMAGGAKGDRALIFGAENLLDPIPSGKPAKPEVIGKGGVSAEEAERAFGGVR